MAEPFVGEVKLWSFNWAPRGWALCNGATMAISQNQALFALLGTYYGGNGTSTFCLPDLQGRTPVGVGAAYPLGTKAGAETVTLTSQQIPQHMHFVQGSNVTATLIPPGSASATNDLANVVSLKAGSTTNFNVYTINPAPATLNVPLATGTVGQAGGNQPHPNMQPSLTLNFAIALQGVFPSRQ